MPNFIFTISGYPVRRYYDVSLNNVSPTQYQIFNIISFTPNENSIKYHIENNIGSKIYPKQVEIYLVNSDNTSEITRIENYILQNDNDIYVEPDQSIVIDGSGYWRKYLFDSEISEHSFASMVKLDVQTPISKEFLHLMVRITYTIKSLGIFANTYTEDIDISGDDVGYQVRRLVLDSISVYKNPNKTSYVQNETIDLTGMVVRGTYKYTIANTTAKDEDIVGYTTNANTIDMTTIGQKEITISYSSYDGSKTTTLTINVEEAQENPPYVPPTIYVYKNLEVTTSQQALYSSGTLNCDDLEITVDKYENDTFVETVNVGDDDVPITRNNVYLNRRGSSIRCSSGTTVDLDTYDVGNNQTFEFNCISDDYVGEVAYLTANVVSPSMTDFEISLLNDFKKTYYENDTLDLSGLTITETMDYGSNRIVSLSSNLNIFNTYTITINGEVVHNGDTVRTSFNGRQITITKSNITCTTDITNGLTVNALSITSVAINPNVNLNYFIYDKIDLSAFTFIGTYNNSGTTAINWGDSLLTCNIASGYEITTSSLTLEFTYNSLTVNVSLNITAPLITSLTIDTTNAITQFKSGEAFSTNGLGVTIHYQNGATQTASTFTTDGTTQLYLQGQSTIDVSKVSNTPYDIVVSVTNPNNSSDTKTATYQVSVTKNSTIVDIELRPVNNDDYSTFIVGQSFTLENRVNVLGVYADGDTSSISNYTVTPATGTIIKKAGLFDATIVYITTSGSVKTKTITFNAVIQHQTYTNVSLLYKPKIIVKRTTQMDGDVVVNTDNIVYELNPRNYPSDTPIVLDYEKIFPLFDVLSSVNSKIEGNKYLTDYSNGSFTESYNDDCVGYIICGNENENAKILLFDDFTNVNTDGNITVKYPHYVEGYADRINKCKFGKVFNKRLFISGNPNYKNTDWHSSEINTSNNMRSSDEYQQLTYFSDLDYCNYGTDDTAIVGYDIYRDGTLVVVKEGSKNEATLYERKYNLTTAIDSSGNELSGLYEEHYSCFDINNNGGDGGLNYRSITNFMGDTIILTHRGLKLLQTKNTTYNSEKIAYDVSTYINNKIIKENLKNAYLSVFRERIFLQTSRGLYIGEYNLRNEDNEYEWYFISSVNADQIFNYDDELYFAEDDGNIYKFATDSDNIDRDRDFLINNDITVNITSSHFTKSNNVLLPIKNNGYNEDSVKIYINVEDETNGSVTPLHAKIIDYNVLTSNGIENNGSYISVISFNDKLLYAKYVYFDNLSTGSELEINTKYMLKEFTQANSSQEWSYYKIYKYPYGSNDIVDITNTSKFTMSLRLDEECEYGYHKDDGNSYRLHNGSGDLQLMIYNKYIGRTYKYHGVITKSSNIPAYFITKPYDMGSISYRKNLKSWTVANDTNINSTINVGFYLSRKQGQYSASSAFQDDLEPFYDELHQISGGSNDLFGSSTFSKLTFEKNVLPHVRTTFKFIPNVDFIRFKFFNNDSSNIVLSTLEIVYSFNRINGGN